MDFVVPKLRPVVKTPGGQAYACRWIIEHMVSHEVFCEPFAGGLNVLLNKPRVSVEFAGDTNSSLMNLYAVLGDPGLRVGFCEAARALRYEEGVFEAVRSLSGCSTVGNGELADPELGGWLSVSGCLGAPASVRDAVLFYALSRMSRNGEGVEDFRETEVRAY